MLVKVLYTSTVDPSFLAETNFILYLLVHFETMRGKTDPKKIPQARTRTQMHADARLRILGYARLGHN